MVDDETIVELVSNSDELWDRPFTTSSDVADHVGMSRQAIHRRLDNLHDAGELQKYKPGRGVIWWVEENT